MSMVADFLVECKKILFHGYFFLDCWNSEARF